MAETLSTAVQRQRAYKASRIQSPISPFFIGSNDDNLERAQTRAARAAAVRRKAPAPAPSAPSDLYLGKEQILELFQNCIKLASENKINQKNTWELGLIDHLGDIIKGEEEADTETNFQKASCTLEAGVKIYSLRVDSVHSEAYKVLGGINRAGQENEKDTGLGDAVIDCESEGPSSSKEVNKASPSSMLELSFDVLNVKKFDVAFTVDPLYHQTSAQFDEGGASGLLLNNLGIYGDCRVLFDSEEIPGRCKSEREAREITTDRIDMSFASDCIGRLDESPGTQNEISPSLKDIVNQFDEHNRRASMVYPPSGEMAVTHTEWENDDDGGGGGGVAEAVTENFDTWSPNNDEHASMENADFNNAMFSNLDEAVSSDVDDDRTGSADRYLCLGFGFASKRNAWAGPDHWKYRKSKAEDVSGDGIPPSNVDATVKKKKNNKKKTEMDIDFGSVSENMPDLLVPPKNPKLLVLPSNRVPSNSKLPEDCHYHPGNLVRLFLLPTVLCLGLKRRRISGHRESDFNEIPPEWGEEAESDTCGSARSLSDAGDSAQLVSKPRQVTKVEVEYDKASKQVDVHALKETLWECIQAADESGLSLKQTLGEFPMGCRASAAVGDVSPHLCFICLLHLANEHGLIIKGCTPLDDVIIHQRVL